VARDTARTIRLSLEEALSRAETESFPVRTARAESRRLRARKRQTLGIFLPRITASEEGAATTDPLNAFGFQLKQASVTQRDFAPARLNDPERIDNFTTKVEVEQPLVNVDGFFRRRAASDAARAAALAEQRTQEVIAFRVKKGYFGLVLAERRLGVIDSALTAARANRRQAEALYDEGVINRADVLAARVRVSELESRRTRIRANRRTAADRLRVLLGLSDAAHVQPTDSLQRQRAVLDTVDVRRLNRTRSDMRALRARADAAQAQVRAAWTAFLPSLNARGSYAWNGDSVFGTEGEGYTVGAALTWDVFSGFEQIGSAQEAEARLQQSRIRIEQQALHNQAAVAEALREVRAARQQIAQTQTAVDQAEESLRIRSDRYAEGLARTTDVLQAEATLAERRLAYLQALYDHNLAVYRLELLLEREL
jgi:outer membrane protein TolC